MKDYGKNPGRLDFIRKSQSMQVGQGFRPRQDFSVTL